MVRLRSFAPLLILSLMAACTDPEMPVCDEDCREVVEPASLSRVDAEPPGTHCAAGGTATRSGLDVDLDGVLDDAEVTATRYACKPVELVEVDEEPAGAHCAGGGAAIRTGFDVDGDGVLGDAEVQKVEYTCSRTIAGDFTVANRDQLIALADIEVITGDLEFSMWAKLGDVELRALHTVGGTVRSQFGSGITTLSLPVLASAGGVDLIYESDLEKVWLPALVRAGTVEVRENKQLEQLDLHRLQSVGTLVLGGERLDSLYLSSLEVAERLDLRGLATSPLSIPVQTAGRVVVSGVKSRTVELPNLVSTQSLTIYNNDKMTSFWAPLLSAGALSVVGNDALTAIDLPALSRTSSVRIDRNHALTSLGLPVLGPTTLFYINDNPLLTRLDGTSIDGGDVVLQNNHLETLDGFRMRGATELRIVEDHLDRVDLEEVAPEGFGALSMLQIYGAKLTSVSLGSVASTGYLRLWAPRITALSAPALRAVTGRIDLSVSSMSRCAADAFLGQLEQTPPMVEVHAAEAECR